MGQFPILTDNAFAVLSFLAAPAILTNAATVLALGTSNRLARAADRARLSSAAVVQAKNPADPLVRAQMEDFHAATRRAQLLVRGLARFYLAAGCFAAGTCIALVGAFAEYFHWIAVGRAAQVATIGAAVVGVLGLVHGSLMLVRETRLTLGVLETQHALITQWRAGQDGPPTKPAL